MKPAGVTAYDLAFQISPIILVGGIAANVLGGKLPIIALLGQAAAFSLNSLSGGASLNDFYATFTPIPGAKVISNAIGTYPFANQQVAANAIIKQPLNVSLMMTAPVKATGGYAAKLALFTALRTSLESHNAAGGTYDIATPSYIYTNCVMLEMTDVTSGAGKQQQIQWQLDFSVPIISKASANQAFTSYNSLASRIAGGSQVTTSSWSSPLLAAGTQAQTSGQGLTGLSGTVNQYFALPQ